MLNNVSFSLKCLILTGIIFRFLVLGSYGFWEDEAFQFWAAKGIKPFQLQTTNAQVQNTRLPNLIRNTHKRLLGSPTFTLCIHYWSRISNSVFWLRIIPCLFGIGALLLMYIIAIGCGFSKNWALLIAAFCAWNAPWVYYSVELRPISFEIFCSALTLLLLIRILKKNTLTLYIWLTLSILLGITSGYGYFIYYPFIVIFLIFYVVIKERNSIGRKFLKVLIVTTPVIASLFYAKYNKLTFLITKGFQPGYLTYLSQYSGLTYFLNAIRMIMYTVSWQLFNVRKIFLFDLPLGLPFIIITILFLIYSLYILLLVIKKKNVIESAVLGAFIYSIIICIVLSTKGLAPLGPSHHNLFFSPLIFISFFICVRYAYQTLKMNSLKIKENFVLIPLLAFLLAPSVFRNSSIFFNYKEVVWLKNIEDWRVLLKKIQETVNPNDKVSVYVNGRSIPAFIYELRYSNIPWAKKLNYEDISTDYHSFMAGKNSGYDYQWYMIANIFDGPVNEIKERLKKEYDIIVDKEYFLPRQGVAGFRARVK